MSDMNGNQKVHRRFPVRVAALVTVLSMLVVMFTACSGGSTMPGASGGQQPVVPDNISHTISQ